MFNSKDNVVAKTSLAFAKRPRVTILVAIFLLVAGYFAYAKFLKREGFPAVAIPIVQIQSFYFVNNPTAVDQQLTTPIEQAIKDVDNISKIQSGSGANYSSIIVQFTDGTDAEVGKKNLQDAIDKGVKLPNNARVTLNTFNAGTFDGTHDFLLAISADRSLQDTQNLADSIAIELGKLSLVQKAETIKLLTTETDPTTGKQFQNQSSFNRVGFRQNGQLVFKPVVSIGLVKTKDAGVLDLSKQVHDKMNELAKSGKLQGATAIYSADFAVSLNQEISSLQETALLAIIIIFAVLVLFINLRSALLLTLFLPLTLGAVFLALFIAGQSLNVISLFALILVLGIFVDDGTIIVEAIDYYRAHGFTRMQAVREAINDIGIADLSGTLTTIFVFVPMLFITGILGQFIILIPITVILAMALSVIIALTIIPFLSVYILKPGSISILGPVVSWTSRNLARFTTWYLQKKWHIALLVFLSLVLIGAGSSFASKLEFAVFATPKDSQDMIVSMSFPPGTTLDQAESKTKEVEGVLKNVAGSQVQLVSYYGADKSNATIAVHLTPINSRHQTATEYVNQLNDKFGGLNGVDARAVVQSAGPPTEEYPFKMQIFSEDPQALQAATNQINDFVQNLDLGNGQKVAGTQVSDPNVVMRQDNKRFVQISAKFSTTENTSGSVLALKDKVQKEFNSSKLQSLGLNSDALGFDFGQESENLNSFNSAIVAFGIAMIAIYLVLLLEFNSFFQPLLVLLAIPFAAPGVFAGLYFTHNPLSFFSMLGMIALSGIVINNTIVLMAYANHARADGRTYKEAIVEALRIRFRPIITTSVTTIAALLPLGLMDPFWESLTFSMVFGLASSVILVLLVFPAYYAMAEALRSWIHKPFNRFHKEEAE